MHYSSGNVFAKGKVKSCRADGRKMKTWVGARTILFLLKEKVNVLPKAKDP